MDKSVRTTIVEQQNIAAATTQKSKKKSKNKKTNGKISSANSSPDGVPTDVDETVQNGENFVKEVAGDTMNTANGLTEKLEQYLHITGDGLQMNGITSVHADKCHNSQVHSHVAQNGYYNRVASANATTNNIMNTSDIPVVDALKKSKSKSNKQQNKEPNLVVEFENNLSNHKHRTDNNSSINQESILPATASSTAAMINSTNADLAHLKNGFHLNMKECVDGNIWPGRNDDEELQQRATIKDVTKTYIEKAQAQHTLSNIKNSKVLTPVALEVATAPADMAALVLSTLKPNVALNSAEVTPLSDTTLQQQKETLESIAPQQANDITNANPPTAILENTNKNNKNTAKQDADNISQRAVANSKTVTTSSQEATLSVSAQSTVVNTTNPPPALDLSNVHIEYKEYESELQMHDIMRLIQAELSEPYSIYTYRYFIYNWPKLCFLAEHGNEYVGAIVCKLDMHMNVRRGYIAMLAVRKEYRKLKIGTTLVQKAIEAMLADNADEVVLETEMRNMPALRLYENLGFVRDKRLFRYYLNGVDALRLKLWFR
ncbi:uncharacterized protein Naa30A [Eurosta solidaginis]|uniref:uncharacterized protein Naa30A n=1 Tax=Eurosta solidaginis TaxID=178769 RepID=UPI00353083C6